MDLGTVEKRLQQNGYAHAHEFWEDLQLVWNNALLYNTEGEVPDYALELQRRSTEMFDKIENRAIKKTFQKIGRKVRQTLMEVLRSLDKP
eukprot:UN02643